MEALKTALLPAAVLIPTFLTLNYFGLMVMKFSFFSVGNAMGTPTRFWGEYRHMNGHVSKSFRITKKYSELFIQVEPVSGGAQVEVLGQNGGVLYDWNIRWPMEWKIDCRNMERCKVRITSEDFCGKFDIILQ